MKKTTLIALLTLLAASFGAVAVAFVYLRRREADLEEYEDLLFDENYADEIPVGAEEYSPEQTEPEDL